MNWLLLMDDSFKNHLFLVSSSFLFYSIWSDELSTASKSFPILAAIKYNKFFLQDGTSEQVPFMTSEEEQYIRAFNGSKVLGLPYKQGEDERHFSMYFFLPDAVDGLPALVEKVCCESGFLENHLPCQRVEVGGFRIPKFKIFFGFQASEVLNGLGLVLPFAGNGFTEMVDSSIGQNLYVSSIFHKSFIEVNEGGKEAATATAIEINVVL